MRQANRLLGLTAALDAVLPDPRHPDLIVHHRAVAAFHQVLVESFIASFATAPAELILDFDATDDRVHGSQEGHHFHGYYGDWCFLPLYVFCGEQLLVSYLRRSNRDASRHSGPILKLLAKRLRQAWPG